MPNRNHTVVAVYPGSFDPVTLGHLDVIRRAARLFNRLIVGIGTNPDKEPTFTQSERLALLRPHLRGMTNVSAESYDGLTIEFVRRCAGRVLVRGIRDVADLSDEVQIANLNLTLGGIETVFLLTNDQYALTSSTYVKQIYLMGGGETEGLARLVPPNVIAGLASKLGRPRLLRRKRQTR